MQPNETNIKSNKRVAYHATPTNKYEINKFKQNSAITLIALVITIIVLLILAGITLNIVIGENGIFSKAKQAKEDYKTAQEDEQKGIDDLYSQLLIATEGQTTVDYTTLNDIIKNAINDKFKIKTVTYDNVTIPANDRVRINTIVPDEGYTIVSLVADYGNSGVYGHLDGTDYILRNTYSNSTTLSITLTALEMKQE